MLLVIAIMILLNKQVICSKGKSNIHSIILLDCVLDFTSRISIGLCQSVTEWSFQRFPSLPIYILHVPVGVMVVMNR